MENANLRTVAVALLVGSLLGCAWTVARSGRDSQPTSSIVGEVAAARPVAPLAVPPSADYGHPLAVSHVHPLTVAAAIAAFSLFGLAAFPYQRRRRRITVQPTSRRLRD